MKNHRHLSVYGIIIKNNKILLIKKAEVHILENLICQVEDLNMVKI